jgi:hypothetical protein
VVRYRQPLSRHQYLLWVPVIFITSGLIITLLNPVSGVIEGWFDWIPSSLRLGMGLSEAFTRAKLIQTYALHFIFIIFVAPTVEEWYFRGYLLPRVPEKLGWSSPRWSTACCLHSITSGHPGWFWRGPSPCCL